ncbi:50S ribosomal protein L22 [Salinispira pacifica]|uniref:Large ribosomal subunit protein uL22 n=1 Tax=Salinispira pacifica TaxID=1307761 RepID=V5WER4_9SPIO|nr:50S ribosomal protein L22 [Salinispira pacifica]AHC14302.1 LSU ribosomal protein L22p (L17e) [Salinispira pacifica]
MAEKRGYKAHARYVLISPTKVRRVADNVRRKSYPEAIAILENLPHKGAKILQKVIQSAAANALYQNKQLDEDMLFISELMVNEGPRMKRLWRRGRGRADVLLKRMSHVTAVVDEVNKAGV